MLLLLLFGVQGHQIPPGLSSCVVVMPFLESGNSRGERREESSSGWGGGGELRCLEVPVKASSVQPGMWVWSWTGPQLETEMQCHPRTKGMRP